MTPAAGREASDLVPWEIFIFQDRKYSFMNDIFALSEKHTLLIQWTPDITVQ